MEELKKLKRQKRGQVLAHEVEQCEDAGVDELIALLRNKDAKKRTIAAVLSGNRRITIMIPQLCSCLVSERSLYSRIAISEALGKMGEPAVVPLIALLGKIGNNQETKLPLKYCTKKSYPLARDMAARTLVKIGQPALPALIDKIRRGDDFETQQAIDAIGGIVSKTNDQRPLKPLLETLNGPPANEVTTWKIIRALSAFKHSEAIAPLVKMLESHPLPALRWEAARSLGQSGFSNPTVIPALQNALQDQNSEVRKAAKIALEQLKAV
ncbi:MAG: HEAT repeat domain-containing protein [Dehalococcoidales bacterium]|nr:HEAT repeat domain-containing protein [Dehalococcoidales bacterium]